MPAVLIQRLARHIAALHQYGTALLSTHDGGEQIDVHTVSCCHTAEGYFIRVDGYAALSECITAGSQAILLLSNPHDDAFLIWVGSTQALTPQECCFHQVSMLLPLTPQETAAQHSLLQLVPQHGRFCRPGSEDVRLNDDDWQQILNWQVAA